MIRFYFFFVYLFLQAPGFVFALDHQEEIAVVQRLANSMGRPYPIWVFDRDDIHFLFVSHKVVGESKKTQRLELLGKYIFEKTNAELNSNDLENIDTYLSVLPESAVALPLQASFSSNAYKFCAVFPLAPNGNTEIETSRMLQLDFKTVYPNESYSQLSKKMSFDELYLFSLYHEVGHCLDPVYMPIVSASHDDSHAVHLSEAFAEVFAYMNLYSRFNANIADTRALYRTIYSRRMGEFLAQDSSGGLMNPHRAKGGVIYYLTPYLMYAYEQIHFKKINPQNLTPQELIEATIDIVETKEIESRSFTAIALALQEGFEPIVQKYQDYAFNSPDFFYTAYLQLLSYRHQTDAWLSRAFTGPALNAQKPMAPEIPVNDLCTSIINKDRLAFLNALSIWRDSVQKNDYDASSVRERYDIMNALQPHLDQNCF